MNSRRPPHPRSRKGALVVGASVAFGLAASVGLQVAGDVPKPAVVAMGTDCAPIGAAYTAL